LRYSSTNTPTLVFEHFGNDRRLDVIDSAELIPAGRVVLVAERGHEDGSAMLGSLALADELGGFVKPSMRAC
jgi:hypothetical protein